MQKWPLSESRKKRESEERRCLLFIRGHSACKYGECGDSVVAVITVSHLGYSWQCVLLLFSPWGQVVVNVWMLTVPTHKLRRVLWLWIVMPSQNINSLSFLQYFPQTSTFIFIFFSYNSECPIKTKIQLLRSSLVLWVDLYLGSHLGSEAMHWAGPNFTLGNLLSGSYHAHPRVVITLRPSMSKTWTS